MTQTTIAERGVLEHDALAGKLLRWATGVSKLAPTDVFDLLADLLGGQWINDAPISDRYPADPCGWHFFRVRRNHTGDWEGVGDYAPINWPSQEAAARFAIRYFYGEVRTICGVLPRISVRANSQSISQQSVAIDFDGKQLISFDNTKPWRADLIDAESGELSFRRRPPVAFTATGARFAYWMCPEFSEVRAQHLAAHTKQDLPNNRYRPARATPATLTTYWSNRRV